MTREWNEPRNNQMQADERGNGKAVPRSLLIRVLRPRLNVITRDFSAEVSHLSAAWRLQRLERSEPE